MCWQHRLSNSEMPIAWIVRTTAFRQIMVPLRTTAHLDFLGRLKRELLIAFRELAAAAFFGLSRERDFQSGFGVRSSKQISHDDNNRMASVENSEWPAVHLIFPSPTCSLYVVCAFQCFENANRVRFASHVLNFAETFLMTDLSGDKPKSEPQSDNKVNEVRHLFVFRTNFPAGVSSTLFVRFQVVVGLGDDLGDDDVIVLKSKETKVR